MPGFHHSVAVAGEKLRMETSLSIHRDEETRTLNGSPPTAERQKIGFDPIATERRLRRNGRWQRQRRSGIFHVGNVILTIDVKNVFTFFILK